MKKLFFSKPLQKAQPELIKLERSINEIANISNQVEAIVKLFQVISPLHDENPFTSVSLKLGKRKGKYAKQLKALAILQNHFVRAGRSPYGFNRTEKGETVTADKVYLGDVFGLWTKTAAYWLSEKSKLEQVFRPDASRNPENPVSNWYLINDYQCGNFVKSHVDGILEQITILKAA